MLCLGPARQVRPGSGGTGSGPGSSASAVFLAAVGCRRLHGRAAGGQPSGAPVPRISGVERSMNRGGRTAGFSPMANAPGCAGVPPARSFSRALRPFLGRRDAYEPLPGLEPSPEDPDAGLPLAGGGRWRPAAGAVASEVDGHRRGRAGRSEMRAGRPRSQELPPQARGERPGRKGGHGAESAAIAGARGAPPARSGAAGERRRPARNGLVPCRGPASGGRDARRRNLQFLSEIGEDRRNREKIVPESSRILLDGCTDGQ